MVRISAPPSTSLSNARNIANLGALFAAEASAARQNQTKPSFANKFFDTILGKIITPHQKEIYKEYLDYLRKFEGRSLNEIVADNSADAQHVFYTLREARDTYAKICSSYQHAVSSLNSKAKIAAYLQKHSDVHDALQAAGYNIKQELERLQGSIDASVYANDALQSRLEFSLLDNLAKQWNKEWDVVSSNKKCTI